MVSTFGYIEADEVDLVGHLSHVIGVGDEEDTIAELVEWPRLKGSRVEYPTGSSRFREFCKAKSSLNGIWGHAFGYRGNFFRTCSISQGGDYLYLLPDLAKEKKCRRLGDEVSLEYVQSMRSDKEPLELNNRTITKGISCKALRKESFIDVIAKEGAELEAVLKELEISRFKRVANKDGKVRKSQAKRRMAGKTPGSMEEKLLTPELNTPLKLARPNEMPDGPVDMVIVSSTVVRNLAKRKAVKRGAASRSVTLDSVDDSNLRPRFEVEAGLLEEQCRAKAREKMVAVVDDEFKKEIASSRLRVVELEGLLEVEKKSSAELQKELDVAKEREEQTLLYNTEYADKYEALISQYEYRLDDNVKLSLKLEEAKRQVEDKTAIILSRDLALNQLTNELAKLKEKAASGSWHEVELAEYNIRALNEQLLKREIDLDTARTNLVVSEANFEKLSSSIVGKNLELRNSTQIRDSLITRLDRLKADLHHLKGREALIRADLAEVQAKTKSLVDELAHARRNVRRVV
ncbi:hypothetical protein GIB67_011688 [Kingdonia uniflora]|uniref:Uncharacterized protein n=1 Tax=Kingdonia uniflora TaxID=39325 RepID=A0A7J7LU71_9MAGN|nr:hypothetical protein GIB67_011688 [Kingdonia uniflora]